jgi:hypothetical protein
MIANGQWANQLDTNNSANKGARHLAARIGVSPSDGEVPPPLAVVRDLEVAAKKRRGSPRLGVLQPGAGRVGRGETPKTVRLTPQNQQALVGLLEEVWTPS